MRAGLRITLAGVLAVLALSSLRADGVASGKSSIEAKCGDYGTSVHFEKSPSAAARKAIKEEKLVMVLHVSGDFENPEFT